MLTSRRNGDCYVIWLSLFLWDAISHFHFFVVQNYFPWALIGCLHLLCKLTFVPFLSQSWQIYVFGFANENPHRMKKCAVGRTRFTITCLKTFASRIAVGDCRDGVLFYSYNEVIQWHIPDGFVCNSALSIGSSNPGSSFVDYYQSHRKLELIYSDPAQRLVGDIALLNCETAVVSDRRGSISVLSSTRLESRY